ncbi:hypothetical protein UA08_01934 [Talaromyces atroroseus]|uniref:Elongator complex protein 6 n=1 Tax=Talaromyces atroroseus TaxID=1441469 RepID=A0A1Q5QBE2_TALAT|nr:hypothetical protein UA08_01934 [Talaromyces atroroseus]OKL63262.1 hypothetical protein UA08_01934 [Talaromyces atroroseus]
MPAQPPIPPLLTPYISTLSPQSLTLVTSVLAATSNWLVLRYLYSVLSRSTALGQANDNDVHRDSSRAAKRIVLVSFLRDWVFWKAEGKRLGLDLQRFVDADRLRFVDGLTGLFDGQPQQQNSRSAGIPTRPGAGPGSGRTIPMRGGPAESIPVRTHSTANVMPTSSTNPKQLHISSGSGGMPVLNGLENDILSVIKSIVAKGADNQHNKDEEQDVLLIIDQPDFVLAATPGIDADDMSDWIMGLQQHVHSTIVTTSADFPLVHNANEASHDNGPPTPLERHHAAFVVGLAHRASMVLQLRMLDTGAAKDVSGVMRMSKGGGGFDADDGAVEKEVLYFVQRDGGVKVFGRGEV